MITQEQLYDFVTTDSEDEAYELLLLILAYLLSAYDNALKEAAEEWNVEITEPDTVREDYAIYVISLLTNFRERARQKALDLMSEDVDDYTAALKRFIEIGFNAIERTERENAQQTAQLHAVVIAAYVIGNAEIYKTWRARPNCCSICAALDGITVPIDTPFLVNGQMIDLADGKTFIYKYKERQIALAHPNCGCWVEFSIRQK